jgi:formylglycine-generating enzyme required for sulfatase activity
MPSPSATKPPVVFLAFSGVAVGNYMPLPRLADEAAQLRTVFRAAKRAGQCELELLENATLTQILDIFQDSDLHGRIAIFHYAGHADSYSLLLQEAKGEELLAHAGGLAAFLAQQPGLQLAFLNGCSTEAQVADLHAAGIPAVVATTLDVLDDWAEQFAVRFYKGLVGGATIAGAFGAAQAEIEARHGKQAEWPWRLHLHREEDGAWTLTTRTAPAEDALSAEGQPSSDRGKLLARTLTAIQGAYSRDELRRALRLGMNENLDALVADKPFGDQVFQLLDWAERRNRLKELVACLHEYNSDNEPLALVYEEVVAPQTRTARPAPAGAQPAAKPETLPTAASTPDLAAQPAPHSDGSRQVFLAYSRKDAELMRRLRADLLAAGIVVWVDDQDLEPGTLLWQRAIGRALRESHCLIALLSPEACESEWVNNEITLAKKRNLRIFPVLLRGDEDDAVPLALVSVQYVDARVDYDGAVRGRLLPAVRKHLGLAPVRQVEDVVQPASAGTPQLAAPAEQAHEQQDSPPQAPAAARQVEDVVQPASSAPPQLAAPAELRVLLDWEHFSPEQRNAAGERLGAEPGGDTRRGVGLRADGLPDIDWVEVPEADAQGRREFIYQEDERRVEPTFWMARFPVTYAQYQAFAAAGYADERWWKELAAPEDVRRKPGWQRFPFWNHPREMVSWYEAVAFCRWLSSRAEERRDLLPPALRGVSSWRISLPTEWQWEKAARGHDGRQYPWGGAEYRSGYANINETYAKGGRKPVGKHYLQKTSAVGMYPQGASPYGICDLSGNIWEWCLNEHANPHHIQEAGTELRVLRGGSWYGPYDLAAAALRYGVSPRYRDFIVLGFRVVVCAVPVS